MNVTLSNVVVFLLLWVSKTKAPTTPPPAIGTPNPTPVTQTPAPPTSTPIPPTSTPTTPPGTSQDTQDAQTIINSQMKEDVVAGILVYREKSHRIVINQQITTINSGKPFIGDDYIPTNSSNPVFLDLCFGLVKDENVVLSGYLGPFLECKDETWIIIALVLTKNMQSMITTYNAAHKDKFEDMVGEQRHPFQNMLKVWCAQNREEDEQGTINQHNASEDAKDLKKEQDDGGWQENRDQIEKILMKKSIKYAQVVIQEFEKANGGKPIEDLINENIEKNKLNHDLADAYSSLARFIKNKYKYMADIMCQYSDGKDRWAAWIMCIAVVEPTEWSKVDDAFKQGHPNESLSKFIMEKNVEDKIMAEMMAAIIDPTFKPTTFAKSSAPDGLGLSTSTPPPVTPTMMAPTPTSSNPSALTPGPKPTTPPATTPPSSTTTPQPSTTTPPPSTTTPPGSPTPPAPLSTPAPGAPTAPASPSTTPAPTPSPPSF